MPAVFIKYKISYLNQKAKRGYIPEGNLVASPIVPFASPFASPFAAPKAPPPRSLDRLRDDTSKAICHAIHEISTTHQRT